VTTLTAVLVAIFSVGGALAIRNLFAGYGLIKSGAARTEARAIRNLEKYRDEADDRAERAQHLADYRATVAEHYRAQYADLAYHVRESWGAEHLLPVTEPPKFVPLPPRSTKQLAKKDADQ
jgi:hypothetical protein